MADFLTLQDLYAQVGSQKVHQYLRDDGSSGALSPLAPAVVAVLDAAEGEAYSRMLRHYGSRDSIIAYAQADAVFRWHVAWIAIQFASERRSEFTSAEGQGAYQVQYERAIKYIENVSKGRQRGTGEEEAGKGANTGGNLAPRPPAATERNFVFSPSSKADGHGGF